MDDPRRAGRRCGPELHKRRLRREGKIEHGSGERAVLQTKSVCGGWITNRVCERVAGVKSPRPRGLAVISVPDFPVVVSAPLSTQDQALHCLNSMWKLLIPTLSPLQKPPLNTSGVGSSLLTGLPVITIRVLSAASKGKPNSNGQWRIKE